MYQDYRKQPVFLQKPNRNLRFNADEAYKSKAAVPHWQLTDKSLNMS